MRYNTKIPLGTPLCWSAVRREKGRASTQVGIRVPKRLTRRGSLLPNIKYAVEVSEKE